MGMTSTHGSLSPTRQRIGAASIAQLESQFALLVNHIEAHQELLAKHPQIRVRSWVKKLSEEVRSVRAKKEICGMGKERDL